MVNSPYNILIFEDDIDLILQWKVAFESIGYRVDYTSSFEEAKILCLNKKYHAIVCDIFIKDMAGNLDGIGGVTFINFLKKRSIDKLNWTKQVPIIIVSGSLTARKDDGQYYTKKFDAKETLLKPFDPLALVDKVKQHIVHD